MSVFAGLVSAVLPCPITWRATAGLHAEGHLYASCMTAEDLEIRGSKKAPPLCQNGGGPPSLAVP